MLRNPVLFELKSLPWAAEGAPETEETLQMDQESFRALYEQTARPIWVFLLRRTGDESQADDLLQETYYRFLRIRRNYSDAAHRRNYLFRIASNVANDAYRRGADSRHAEPVESLADRTAGTAGQGHATTDLARAMKALKPRQREALWLAYAEGSTHEEIAEILGLKKSSIKPLLFRARAKLASLLRGGEGRSPS